MMTTHDQSLETGLSQFLAALSGKNRGGATIEAYRRDLIQFFDYIPVSSIQTVTRMHITDYLTYLIDERELSGVSAARKLTAIREYFKHLVFADLLEVSPAAKVQSPHQEKKSRRRMHKDEYSRILSLAGSKPRDFAMFTLLLQCGLRVTELCNLKREDIDLTTAVLIVRDGKGQKDREILMEKKARRALKTYLDSLPESDSPALFLNRYGRPLSRFGIHKLIEKYCADAGIERRVSAHLFRHTWISEKADRNMPLPLLQRMAGHKDPKTTMGYYHMSREVALKWQEATSI